ncbi:MAG: glycosyltransferase [Desulfomonile sp.]
MDPSGLAIAGFSRNTDSAYSFRIRKLAEGLEENAVRCDLFFMSDNKPLDTQTTASLFMPWWLPVLRQYDFVYCGAPMVGQALYFSRMFVPGLIILDMHGDDVSQSAQANELRSGEKRRSASLRVRIAYAMAMSSADYWLTQSMLQMEDLIAAGVAKERVSVVRNGVDLKLFRCLPQPKEPEFKFGYAGGFHVWQGINEFVEAFDRLGDPSVRMLMVGFRESDGPLKKALRQRFGSRVELADMVSQESMVELFKSVAILVSARPGHIASRAAFPTKFAEYAALGRPILVNDVDETAHFVRKYKCGFVSDPCPAKLAETMYQASQVPWDKLVEMGTNARRMAEQNFSWEQVGQDYAALIRGITSRFGRTRRRW